MEFLSGSPWLLATVFGVVILGLVMAYGMMRNRGRTPAQKAYTEAATRAEYRDEERQARD